MLTKTMISASAASKSERFEVLDIAKGIGIFFVVFAHVNYTPILLAYIYSFHMPLFFVISGMLFNKEKYTHFSCFIKRRVKTLICPYVLFYIASLCIMFVLKCVSKGFSWPLLHDYYEYFLQMFLSQGSEKVINAPLWFVPCLFAVEIMYYFISKIKGRYNLAIIAVCSILVFFGWLLESGYLPFDNKILPWSLDSALFALGFYAIGNLTYGKVKYAVQKIEKNKYSTLITVTSVILCGIMLVPLVCLNGKISLGSKVLNNGFLLYASGLIGTVGIISSAVLLKKSKLLKFCGLHSFYIMATHYIIRVLYRAVCSFISIMMYDTKSFVQTIIPFIVVMTASIVFSILYARVKNIILNKN